MRLTRGNSTGEPVVAGDLKTDAVRACVLLRDPKHVPMKDRTRVRVWVENATFVALAGKDLFRSTTKTTQDVNLTKKK